MILNPPFEIGPRLAPALRITDTNGTNWISFDHGEFYIDLANGTEHKVTGYRPGLSASRSLARAFGDILSFMEACAESRSYAERRGKYAMDGENSDLFPDDIGQFCQQYSDEIVMLRIEIEETDREFIED